MEFKAENDISDFKMSYSFLSQSHSQSQRPCFTSIDVSRNTAYTPRITTGSIKSV